MAHAFEIAQDIEVDATPEQVWEAIATGPGLDSWFLGHSEIEPRQGGTVRWSIGDFTIDSTVTAWDPPNRFVSAGSPMPDGTFHQFDYAVEPREGSGSAVRFVHSGALGQDDWEAEYEAMSEGDPMYLFKLVQYLKHFKGRFAVSIDLSGPQAPDHETAMAAFRRALGLPDDVALGDRVKLTPDGIAPIEGTVDHLSKDFIGVLSDDAIYRFIHGFIGPMMVGHHIFAEGAASRSSRPSGRAGSTGSSRLSPAAPARRTRLTVLLDFWPSVLLGRSSGVAMTSERATATEQREEDRTRVSRMLEPHAPPDWQQRFRTTELLDSVIDGQPIQMFVMAADIRESTTLMKEAIRFERFAIVMDKFVSSVRLGIRRSGGWFDKFTGDGFLAYWIVQSASPDDTRSGSCRPPGTSRTRHTRSSICSIGGCSRISAPTPGTCPRASASRWGSMPGPVTWSGSPTSSRSWAHPSSAPCAW